jgi:glutamate carboxypeptidase
VSGVVALDDAAMRDELAALVSVESPSSSADATRAAAEAVDDLLQQRLGSRGVWTGAERGHLLWSGGGTPRVLLLGHVDTVWPLGTLARWPFDVVDGRATGPGCFDMKAGLVQGIAALATLDDLAGVALLVTTDEEVGSPTSRGLVEQTATGCEAVLVLEPSAPERSRPAARAWATTSSSCTAARRTPASSRRRAPTPPSSSPTSCSPCPRWPTTSAGRP